MVIVSPDVVLVYKSLNRSRIFCLHGNWFLFEKGEGCSPTWA